MAHIKQLFYATFLLLATANCAAPEAPAAPAATAAAPAKPAAPQAPAAQIVVVINTSPYIASLNYNTPEGNQTNSMVTPGTMEIKTKDSVIKYVLQKNGKSITPEISVVASDGKLTITYEEPKK